jgi:hypothetical protein
VQKQWKSNTRAWRLASLFRKKNVHRRRKISIAHADFLP